MNLSDLRQIVTYCPDEECGEPVAGLSRTTRYTKRQMVFSGFAYFIYAKYQCPVCYYTRYFRLSFWGGDYVTKTSEATRLEARTIITLIVLVIFVGWGVSTLNHRAADKARKEAEARREALVQAAAVVTQESIDVKPEFAEVHDETQVRVLLAARIRARAPMEATMFAPPSGYLLDQDGNRYDLAIMLADKSEKVLDDPVPVSIVPGEIYRYYLVSPTHANPYSDDPPSRRLSKLVLYLNGAPPQEVSIVKHSQQENN